MAISICNGAKFNRQFAQWFNSIDSTYIVPRGVMQSMTITMHITNLEPGRQYLARVRAINPKGMSYYSSESEVMTSVSSSLENSEEALKYESLQVLGCKSLHCELFIKSSKDPSVSDTVNYDSLRYQIQYKAPYDKTWKVHNHFVEFSPIVRGVQIQEVIIKQDKMREKIITLAEYNGVNEVISPSQLPDGNYTFNYTNTSYAFNDTESTYPSCQGGFQIGFFFLVFFSPFYFYLYVTLDN